MKKKLITLVMLLTLPLTFCACEGAVDENDFNEPELEFTASVSNTESSVESSEEDNSVSVAATEVIADSEEDTVETYEEIESDMVEIRLGQPWEDALPYLVGYEEIGEVEYVGETYEGGVAYKWYSHTYDNFIIYTSNLYYDIENRDFDTYIVAQVVTKEAQIDLGIGVIVSDTKDTMISKLGDDYEETDWITYELDDSIVSIVLENDKIAEISAVYHKN